MTLHLVSLGPGVTSTNHRGMGEQRNDDESKTPLFNLIALANYYVAGYCPSGIGSTTVRKG